MLVIDTISKTNPYRSTASPKVQVFGSQRTRISLTHVDRRPCLIRVGSEWVQYLVYGRCVTGGIAALEGLHRGGDLSFAARSLVRDV